MRKITMTKITKESSFKEAYEDFVKEQKVKNSSPETIKYYGYCYKYFSEVFDEDSPCSNINEDVIREYIFSLQNREKPISDKTVQSYITGLRAIIYYFIERGYVKPLHIKISKANKPIKETYTQEELNKILKKPDTTSFKEYRTYVISNCFLGLGCRLSSLINIKIEHVDFYQQTIRIEKTKNRTEQLLPMSGELEKVLKEYLAIRGGEPEDYLFCTQFGDKLAKGTIQQDLKAYNQKRGVTKTSAHLYRHTFAKLWLMNGGDIFSLQSMLGHSTLDIVKEYVTMFVPDLKYKNFKFCPLDGVVENMPKGKTKKIDFKRF